MSLSTDALTDLRAHYDAGLSAREAARRVGCHASTACDYFAAWRGGPAKVAVDFGDLEAVIRRLVEERLGNRPEIPDSSPVDLPVEHAGLPGESSTMVRWPGVPERVFWLSDLHVPYHDVRAVEVALRVMEDYHPDVVVIGGDLWDFYRISRHNKDPRRGGTVQQEIDAAKPIVDRIASVGAQVVFLEGNHDHRFERHVLENVPAMAGILSLRKAAGFPDDWHFYPNNTVLRIGKLGYAHGNFNGDSLGPKHVAAKMLELLETSMIMGHYHREQSYSKPSLGGSPRIVVTTSMLASEEAHMEYKSFPLSTRGAAMIDYAPDGLFSIQPFQICGGRAIVRGRVYG